MPGIVPIGSMKGRTSNHSEVPNVPLYRFRAGYVGEIEAPTPEIAKQIVCQQISASMMLAASVTNFSGMFEQVEVTPEMLAAEEKERGGFMQRLRDGIIKA